MSFRGIRKILIVPALALVVAATITPAAAAAAGARQPETAPQLLTDLESGSTEKAIGARQRDHGNPTAIKIPAQSKLPADPAAFAQAITNDWSKIAGFIKQGSDESMEAIKMLATQVANFFSPLHADVADLREEVEILWWHIGGWSRLLDVPFSELPTAACSPTVHACTLPVI